MPVAFGNRRGGISPILGLAVLIVLAVAAFAAVNLSGKEETQSYRGAAEYFETSSVKSGGGAVECGSIPPWGIARLDLESALESGDFSKSRAAFEQLAKYREEAVYCVGEEHMEFFAPRDKMKSLQRNIENGDLAAAQADLYYLASSCGEAICHKKRGVMGDLELSYFDLKDNINSGDLKAAKASMAEFKTAYYETRDDFRRIIPSQAGMMDDSYIENLEQALASNDLVASKRALSELSEAVCSSHGCHGSLLVK